MLTKQGIDVSFAQGLDTKTDPKRVQIGKFLRLENSVFNKGGLLQKRNGYQPLAALPSTDYSYLTTFNANLTAIGPNIAAFNEPSSGWVQKGSITPLSLRTMPVLRNNLNQINCDTAVAPNGSACTVYLESDGTNTTAKYVIYDINTGQNLSAPAVVPVASGTVTGGLRVFVLGNNFILVFTNVITAVSHLQYVAISIYDPTVIGLNTDIASGYTSSNTLSWDGYVSGSKLYLAFNTTSGGQQVRVTYLTSTLLLSGGVGFATYKATSMTVTVDESDSNNPVIYVSFYRSDTSVGYSLAVNQSLATIMSPQQIISTGAYINLASAAQNGVAKVFAEFDEHYSYDAGIPTRYVDQRSVTAATSTVSAITVSARSVGLGSKAFIVDGVIYYMGAFQSPYQSSYFLINGSTSLQASPVIAARLAYQNGGGYYTTGGIPSVTVSGSVAKISYLFKDLIQAVNKNTNVPSGSQTAGIYSQTGINLVSFNFTTDELNSVETGNNLNLSGGFVWMYDGYLPVEQNFFVYPDSVETSTATGSGGLTAQDYYYQVTYEWTDNQGNAFRSAPSIPVKQTTTTGSSTNTVHVPTLRLTQKIANPVKIVLYRWSTAQQNYYQVTSITSPTLNSTTSDSVDIVDALSDATILGNNLLYTTGGVVEDIAPPATDLLTLFDTRMWLVDAEDRNLLWYSKQIIEATPVEMSDLFTVYIPPTVATATGEITAIYPLDDKLIISKGGNSFVYINGSGPDNTGNNSQYSQPIFITSTVGCANQRSLVTIPQGMMFQSNKGIWILDRNLGTSYIGAPVEDLTTGATVLSAVSVPETNQVRFTLNTGVTLMYDYFYDQWGSFTGIPGISATIFQEMHTFINSYGRTLQEEVGHYQDGSSPVLLAFKTGPLRLADLQGYQRAYFFFLLGQYLSPHKLYVRLYFDYSQSPSQSILITPDNYSTPYGSGASQSPYGQGNPYGGPTNLELWRVFLENQRCMAFNIEIQEVFDPSFGTAPGAGLTISGLNVVCAFKKAFRPISAAHSAG